MKNYDIVADDEKTREYIESKIKRINLEDRLEVRHHQSQPGVCPTEVNYKIYDGDYLVNKNDVSHGLEIRIDESKPKLQAVDAKHVYIDHFDEATLVSLIFDDVLVLLKSEKILKCDISIFG